VVIALALTIFTLAWVFVPAIVIERAGPIGGFKRSLALTKGRRWPVLGIILILAIANGLTSVLTWSLMAEAAPIGGAVLNALATLFFVVLAAVLSAVGYFHLRAEKEGRALDAVVRSFD
jgi:ACR3 family arsenite efflux pump ArsB